MVAGEPEPGFRYWAFISYSHQDKSWGRWVQRALETYRVPQRLVGLPIAAGTIPARLTPVFRDRDELPTATDLDRTVAEALRQSWSLIVICSPASAQSRWVNEEVRVFQRLGRAERIHCLIVDGTGTATVAPCFPTALRERAWSGATAGEPIAADARRSGDGKANARLKLVAGILGVSFDKLAQRDQQRGYRRMAIIAGAAVLALAVLSIFTVVTVTSRRDAEAQRGHAEGLVEFMLGDLRKKLQPEGKLNTLDAVGKEALAYYAAQDPASLDANALARRARALHMIGEVYDERGRLDDALGVFKQAAASTAELLARDKDNPQRIFDHAQSVYWVGYIAWQRGQRSIAEPAFRSYKDLADRLLGIDPQNVDWQAEVEYANGNLGTLLHDEGQADEAATLYERALQVARNLAGHLPNDAARQFELAQSHAFLADARADQGRLQDAIAEREAEVAIYEDILATNPKNHDAKDGLLVAERELGGISLTRGQVPMAVSQLQRATGFARELLTEDPDGTTAQDHSAAAYADLAEALDYAGDSTGARAAIVQSRELATRLVKRDPSVVAWQTRLSRSLLLQARFAVDGGPLDALRQIQGVLQRLDDLSRSSHLDRRARLLYAEGLLMAAERKASLGNREQSRNDWQRAMQIVHGETPIAGPHAEAIRAIALRGLGRADDAAPFLARLDAVGYRDPGLARFLATRSKNPEAENGLSTTQGND
jgi:tetratricopeptide (TPR) repeat protein